MKKKKELQQITIKDKGLIIYKEHEFEAYIMWKSLPGPVKGMTEEQLKKMGFQNPLIISLAKIKTQKEFAQMFGVKEPNLLSDWNKKIIENNLIAEQRKLWERDLTSMVDMSFYRKAREHGDAPRVRLWHELVEGDVAPEQARPTTQVQINNPQIINLGREYEDKLRELLLKQIRNEIPSDQRICPDPAGETQREGNNTQSDKRQSKGGNG